MQRAHLLLLIVLLPGSAALAFEYLQPGIKLSLFAEHPDVVTPTGIDVDEHGRVWVVSSHTHFRPQGYDGPERDEVLILADTDGDGRADKRTVFYTNTVATMDLELNEIGTQVYLAERHRILRLDTDLWPSLPADQRYNDGYLTVSPSEPREECIVYLETEADYPHNGLSGLTWDRGELLFSLGENFAKPWTLSAVEIMDGFSGMEPPPQNAFRGYRWNFHSTPPYKPEPSWIPEQKLTQLRTYGGTLHEVYGRGEGGIFRCKPNGGGLHRIARGFWNPFGLCTRLDGEIFAVDNDPGEQPPCRLLHIVDGGEYGYNRKYGKSPTHPFVAWDGELRGTLPMLHPVGDAPCSVQSLGQGLISTTWSDHRLDFYPLEKKGPGYGTKRVSLLRGGPDFRPVSLARAPDKKGMIVFYLTDWVKVDYAIHGQGRIWRMEIDPTVATWLDADGDTAGEYNRPKVSRSKLLVWNQYLDQATDADPIIAQMAIQRLAKSTERWGKKQVAGWPENHRMAAILVLKRVDVIKAKWIREEKQLGLPPATWMSFFLNDPSPKLRFEALRWIADSDETTLLPAVESMLKEPTLSYRLFEAAIATLNTLKGQPEKGVRDTGILLAKVQDPAASPRLRAYALRLLPEFPLKPTAKDSGLKYPKGLTIRLLQDLIAVGDNDLSIEAVRVLAGKPTRASEKILIGLAEDKDQVEEIRLEAMAGLGGFPPSYEGSSPPSYEGSYTCLARLAGDSNEAIQDEARRGLRFSKVRVPEKTNLTEGRPALTDTEAWLKRLDAVPEHVDVELGERVFHHTGIASCGRCHRHQGRGNIVGPDLTALGPDTDRKWLLEAILQPNAFISPEYTPRMLTLKDGGTFTGFHLRTGGGGAFETLRDAKGQNKRIKRDEIVSVEEVQVSLMPMGLPYTMTDQELRDLIAFLLQNKTNRP